MKTQTQTQTQLVKTKTEVDYIHIGSKDTDLCKKDRVSEDTDPARQQLELEIQVTGMCL